MRLDQEQQEALNEVLHGRGRCCLTGPPGTGKTEVFGALAEQHKGSAGFFPFQRAACKELLARTPKVEWRFNNDVIHTLKGDITISTVHSYCQSQIGMWPGSYDSQLTDFLRVPDKITYDLIGLDELQDLRPLHWEVAKSLMRDRMFAAGDPYQTIFSFSDAMGENIFSEVVNLGCRIITLHNNYRAGPEIVKLLNHVYPREIVAKGPKTYQRSAVFARFHKHLQHLSDKLREAGVPHWMRNKDETDRKVLGNSNLYLMVTHACKGLGFDTVYQMDWAYPRTASEMREEKNLLYVSVARASKEFIIVTLGSEYELFAESIMHGSGCPVIGVQEFTWRLANSGC